MAQGKLKTKVALPPNAKRKSVHRVNKLRHKKPNRPKKPKKDLIQKEVEKEIRKNIEDDARAKSKS